MPSEILAPAKTAAVSSDVTIAASATGTVAIYTAFNDYLHLPLGGHLLLPDGTSFFLLPDQTGGDIPSDVYFPINLKDPLGSYGPSGMQLTGNKPFKTLGPGVWQVARPELDISMGIQSDV